MLVKEVIVLEKNVKQVIVKVLDVELEIVMD